MKATISGLRFRDNYYSACTINNNFFLCIVFLFLLLLLTGGSTLMTGGIGLKPYSVERGAYAPFPGQPQYLGRSKGDELDIIGYNYIDRENAFIYTYGSFKSDAFYNKTSTIDSFLSGEIESKRAKVLFKSVGRLENDGDKLGAYVQLQYKTEGLEIIQHLKIMLYDKVIHQWSIQDASGKSPTKSKALFYKYENEFFVK